MIDSLTDQIAEVVRRTQSSLVVVQNGRHGAGAGIIWKKDGLILTNHHVAPGERAQVTLAEGGEFTARLVARDAELDLALLRIDAADLPAASIADARFLKVGQLVIALGHPWGQRGFVTAGVISGHGTVATRGPRKQVPVLRTDVELGPGSSGGPLINATGGVVGINTMVIGGDLGLAIPSHTASAFVDQALGIFPG